jgi:8-oxo-dGTP diphosphatase
MEQIQYVVGFLFSPDFKKVVLINKNRPDFQKGLYNGVGGRIEENEAPADAMKREFLEETGLLVENWREYCVLQGDCVVYVFSASSEDYHLVQTKTDERVDIIWSFEVPTLNVMPNLRWLIPMASDKFHLHCVANFS